MLSIEKFAFYGHPNAVKTCVWTDVKKFISKGWDYEKQSRVHTWLGKDLLSLWSKWGRVCVIYPVFVHLKVGSPALSWFVLQWWSLVPESLPNRMLNDLVAVYVSSYGSQYPATTSHRERKKKTEFGPANASLTYNTNKWSKSVYFKAPFEVSDSLQLLIRLCFWCCGGMKFILFIKVMISLTSLGFN